MNWETSLSIIAVVCSIVGAMKHIKDSTREDIKAIITASTSSQEVLIKMAMEQLKSQKEDFNRELDRRLKDIVYKDFCRATHEGTDKKVDESIRSLHRRLDDLFDYLNVPKTKRGQG
jgi:hypothetical protein